MPTVIAASVLASDFTRLGEQVREAQDAGAEWIHVDVMDGRFVPNISIGPMIVEACRRVTELPLDVHLMIVEPERYIADVARAGADRITVHAEASLHLHRNLEAVRETGARPGLAVNPLTPLTVFREALPYLDLALVMSVNPGFGGQRFIPQSLQRLDVLRDWRDELNAECLLQVDGGINEETAAKAVRAGVDVLVAGSAVFGGHGSVKENVSALQASLH